MTVERADRIRAAAATRSLDATARAARAVRELSHRGAEVNFAAVAAIAGVSRQFLYTHPQLREEIERLRGDRDSTLPRTLTAEPASDASLRSGSEPRSTTTNGSVRRTPGSETNSPSRMAALVSSRPLIEPAGPHRPAPILLDHHRCAAFEPPNATSKP